MPGAPYVFTSFGPDFSQCFLISGYLKRYLCTQFVYQKTHCPFDVGAKRQDT